MAKMLHELDLRIDEECANPEFLASYVAATHKAAWRRWWRWGWRRGERWPSVSNSVLLVLQQIADDRKTRTCPTPPPPASGRE